MSLKGRKVMRERRALERKERIRKCQESLGVSPHPKRSDVEIIAAMLAVLGRDKALRR